METAERNLLLADLVLSFLWICSSSFPWTLLYTVPGNWILENVWFLLSSFVFSWLGHVTRGGASNPLKVLCYAISGRGNMFPGTVARRLIAQVLGSVIGAGLTSELFPKLRDEVCANMDVHRGALVEAFMAFFYVLFQLGFDKIYPTNVLSRAYISSAYKLMLHLLAGGCMNPASAFGWAFSRGNHGTREHLLIYWFAPLEALLLGFWVFSLLVEEAPFHEEEKRKKKSK